MIIGLISDTHGHLRSGVRRRFRGVGAIVHAGDVGGTGILRELEEVAPVTAVWGNTDNFELRSSLPEVARFEFGGKRFALLHGHQVPGLSAEELAAAFPEADIIVHGHTHQPREDRATGKLVLNPGAAGPPRHGLRPTIATLTVDASGDSVRFIEL